MGESRKEVLRCAWFLIEKKRGQTQPFAEKSKSRRVRKP
jgi:hypothetical protein